MSLHKKKILVFGWYGAGNWGDELLLGQFVRWAKEAGADVTALSVNPTHTMKTHGIPAVDFQDLPAVVNAVRSTDLFVLGGGGLFQTYDEFKFENLYRYKRYGVSIYAKPVLIARQFNVPVLLWAQGVGPLDNRDALEIVREIFAGATAASVRDQASFNLLKGMGLTKLPAVGPDPIWACPTATGSVVANVRKDRGARRRIVVVIRQWDFDKDWQDKLHAALSANLAAGDTLVYLPFQPATDMAVSREFAKRFDPAIKQEFVNPGSLDEIAATMMGADHVVAMRLHAQILSLKLGKPTLCIEYDKKMAYASVDAGVRDDLRLALEDDQEAWNRAVSAFLASQSEPSRVAELEQKALVHQSLLRDSIENAEYSGDRPEWSAGGFDWAGAWSSDEMNAMVRDLQDEFARLSSEFLKKDIEIDALLKGNSERDNEIDALLKSKNELDEELKARERQFGEFSRQLAEIRQDNLEVRAALSGAVAALAAMRDLLDVQERLRDTLAERDLEIESLNERLAESNRCWAALNADSQNKQQRIGQLESGLGELQGAYHQVMQSNSMKITAPLRAFRHLMGRSKVLGSAFFNTARDSGIREAMSKTRGKLERRISSGSTDQAVVVPAHGYASDNERYLIEKQAQDAYVRGYVEAGMTDEDCRVWNSGFIAKADKKKKVVLYPLSYPLELTQRPDHVIRCFVELGYQVVIIAVDGGAPYVRELSPSIYLTNLFAAAITHFSNRDVSFYITYPFYSYILNHLKRASVLYDVLDDLTVFSRYCNAMVTDHKQLLLRSDHVIFSSTQLLEINKRFSKGKTSLVTNGVWPGDFRLEDGDSGKSLNFRAAADEYVVGYHGAISELLDWGLIGKLVELPNVRVVMVGPVVNFDEASAEDAKAMEAVFASGKLTHVEPVAYKELKYYLSGFDAAMIPFKVNKKTDPVSPLKLFEYMAMGLPVYATRTKTLLEYAGQVNVLGSEEIVDAIKRASESGGSQVATPDYKALVDKVDWKNQLAPVIAALADSHPSIARQARGKRVDIVNVNFFDWDGIHVYKGGAERYVYDLACMFKEMGWQARILQNANAPFERDFKGIPVVGVQAAPGHDMRAMSKTYRQLCADADLVIASPADLACELWGLNAIGINHGIYWDHKYKEIRNHNFEEYRNIFGSLKVADSVVAVDTNFINWTRTYDYGLAQKIEYVPNYVDCAQFAPVEKDFAGKVRVLYPRRLYEARGIFITLQAFEQLFERHADIELHLVGQANDEDRKIIDAFVEKFAGRVISEEFDMDEMHQVYRDSQVVLIPTLYSEGTSLSCVEAMASNNAIVATTIGGLPNLVVDEFNGLLIKPDADALVDALERLMSDRALMKNMAANGTKMAAAFDKASWIEKWKRVVARECS